jgi:hypothetical protein
MDGQKRGFSDRVVGNLQTLAKADCLQTVHVADWFDNLAASSAWERFVNDFGHFDRLHKTAQADRFERMTMEDMARSMRKFLMRVDFRDEEYQVSKDASLEVRKAWHDQYVGDTTDAYVGHGTVELQMDYRQGHQTGMEADTGGKVVPQLVVWVTKFHQVECHGIDSDSACSANGNHNPTMQDLSQRCHAERSKHHRPVLCVSMYLRMAVSQASRSCPTTRPPGTIGGPRQRGWPR